MMYVAVGRTGDGAGLVVKDDGPGSLGEDLSRISSLKVFRCGAGGPRPAKGGAMRGWVIAAMFFGVLLAPGLATVAAWRGRE